MKREKVLYSRYEEVDEKVRGFKKKKWKAAVTYATPLLKTHSGEPIKLIKMARGVNYAYDIHECAVAV